MKIYIKDVDVDMLSDLTDELGYPDNVYDLQDVLIALIKRIKHLEKANDDRLLQTKSQGG